MCGIAFVVWRRKDNKNEFQEITDATFHVALLIDYWSKR